MNSELLILDLIGGCKLHPLGKHLMKMYLSKFLMIKNNQQIYFCLHLL